MTISLPRVTPAATLDDRSWFGQHPDRLFRARSSGGVWVIRRQTQDGTAVLLRTFISAIARVPATEIEIAALWYRGGFPDWPPERWRKSARKALRKSRRP